MAAVSRTRKKEIDFSALNRVSTADFYVPEAKRRCRPRAKIYEVERLVSRRKCSDGYECLIHWKGWPMLSCTWEPSVHLPEELISGYSKPPKPQESELQEASQELYLSILSLLKSRAIKVLHNSTFQMRHDIYRYVFQNKGVLASDKKYHMFNSQDFDRLPLPSHWWYALDEHGQGRAVDFPVKMRCFLGKSPTHFIVKENKLVKAPQIPLENVTVVVNSLWQRISVKKMLLTRQDRANPLMNFLVF